MLDPGIHITKVLTSELETLIVNLKQLISISNEGILKCSAQCLTSQLKLSQKGRGGYRGGRQDLRTPLTNSGGGVTLRFQNSFLIALKGKKT